jgi:hypothetical protein
MLEMARDLARFEYEKAESAGDSRSPALRELAEGEENPGL